MSTRIFSFLTAMGMLLISGVVCQLLAMDSEQLDVAAARVTDVPRIVGAWRGHDEATDDPSFAMAGARGYWMRTYVNERTKDAVLVILMCGPSGKMAVHTPEVCYRGAGFELREKAGPVAIKDNADGHMWSALFAKNSGPSARLRLYWAWNAHGEWEAATSPRWQFRREQFLYKLYVSRDCTQQPSITAQADPAAEFLRVFIPAVNQVLFPKETTGAQAP